MAVSTLTQLDSVLRRARFAFRMFAWEMRNEPLSDVEVMVLRMAQRHVTEGRPDLAAEDFRWLGMRSRDEGKTLRNPSLFNGRRKALRLR